MALYLAIYLLMSNTQSSHKPSPFLFFCLLILLGYFGVNVVQTLIEGQSHQDQLVDLEQQIGELKSHKKELQARLKEVQSREFVEAEARNKLNLAQSNETVVIFPEPPAVLADTTQNYHKHQQKNPVAYGYINDWVKLIFE